MSWEFLNIFKKEDLNKLMFSIMVPGWILFLFCGVPEPFNYYILGIAIFASVFCISGVFVYYYKKFQSKRLKKRQARNRELLDKEKDKNRKIEITRMFDGLTEDDKEKLAYIINKGKGDKYSPNVLHYSRNDYELTNLISQAEATCRIFRTGYRHVYDPYGGQPCITITNYTNSITITIEPYLLELIKQYNQE